MKRFSIFFLLFMICLLQGVAQTLKLDGKSQYMSIPNDEAFFPSTGGGYTITFKVKLGTQFLANDARFIGARTYSGSTSNASTTGYEIWGGRSKKQFIAAEFSLKDDPWGHKCSWASLSDVDPFKTFVHVAYVINPEKNETALYLNGNLSKVTSDKSDINITNNPWGNHGKEILVGAGWKEKTENSTISGESFVSYFAECEIDDLHFYNLKLSKNQIIQDCLDFSLQTEGLVAAYDFDEISQTKIPDLLGRHNGVPHELDNKPIASDFSVKIDTVPVGGKLWFTVGEKNEAGESGKSYKAHSQINLFANAAPGYEFQYFLINGKPTKKSSFQLVSDVQITALFTKSEFPKEVVYETVHKGCEIRNSDNRMLQSLMIKGTDDPFSYDFQYSPGKAPGEVHVYQDATHEVINMTCGQKVDVNWTFKNDADHLCYYLYIDYNHDGIFDENKELVSYTYFSDTPEIKVGYNSLGKVLTEREGAILPHIELPQFVVAKVEENVQTRMRFKADWISKDPLGANSKDKKAIKINTHGGTIVDFTVNIHPHPQQISRYVVYWNDKNKDYTFVLKDYLGNYIPNGFLVEDDTEVTVSGVHKNPAYELQKVFVSGIQLTDSIFNVSKKYVEKKENQNEKADSIQITGTFGIKQYTLHIERPTEGGTLLIKKVDPKTGKEKNVTENTILEYGDQLKLIAKPDPGLVIKNYLISGKKVMPDQLPDGLLSVTDAVALRKELTISVEFSQETFQVNFEQPLAGGRYKVMNGDQEITSGMQVNGNTVLTILPEVFPDYRFVGCYINKGLEDEQYIEVPLDGPITFTVKNNINLECVFVSSLCKVSLVQPEHGTVQLNISQNGTDNEYVVYYGQEIELEAVADEGYELDSYLVNGKAQWTNKVIVADDVTISAVFKEINLVEPDYAVPDAEHNVRTEADKRLIHVVTVQGATLDGEPVPFSTEINKVGDRQVHVFVDRTDEIIEMTSGDEIKFDFTHDIEWLHSYLYIDYNHDGIFNEENELVSYSFFDEDNDKVGFNSVGDELPEGNATLDLPKFRVQNVAKNVKTRMRLKTDWNSKNSVGSTTQNIGVNRGSIVDFTVKIHPSENGPLKESKVIYEVSQGGSLYIEQNSHIVKNGDSVPKGSVLTVNVIANPEYTLASLSVNGVERKDEVQFTDAYIGLLDIRATENLNIRVVFEKKYVQEWNVTYDFNEVMGDVTVLNMSDDSGKNISSGESVDEGSNLQCTIQPKTGFSLDYVLVNGEEIPVEHSADGTYHFTISNICKDIHIDVRLIKKEATDFVVTYSSSEGGAVTLKNGDVIVETGTTVPKASTLTLYMIPEEGYELSSVLVDNKEYIESSAFINGCHLLMFYVDKDVNIYVTYTHQTNIAETFDKKVSYVNASQMLYLPEMTTGIVYDIAGQPVMSVQTEGWVPLTGLPKGPYIFRYHSVHGVNVLKFIKK